MIFSGCGIPHQKNNYLGGFYIFKGIIQSVGIITDILEKDNTDRSLCIEAQNLSSIEVGNSIACSGICFTVTDILDSRCFFADVSETTLKATNVSTWQVGSRVNLEQAMRLSDRIDGHLISGHVDGIANILSIEKRLGSYVIVLDCSKKLSMSIVEKGSIALDGVSLTVNSLKEECKFSVNIIPHTWNNTIFKYVNINDKVNLEIDLLTKYINRYLKNKSYISSYSKRF